MSRASREIGDSGERHQPSRAVLLRWTEGICCWQCVKVMELISFTLWEDIRTCQRALEGR